MRHTRACLFVLATLLAGGCRRSELVSGVSDSTWVATMAELKKVQLEPGMDSSARARARQRVLQRRGLTVEQLDRAARSLADDPERASALWQAVQQKGLERPAPRLPRPTTPQASPPRVERTLADSAPATRR